MSDYTVTTNFTLKDSLSAGDPDKLVIGAEFGAEFDAIATAIATKADSATTLAGYGITDAYTTAQTYTQAEVNALTWDFSSDITSKPTTLSGYGITDAYTIAEVNALTWDWSDIVSGKPTTLAGYGITDAATSAQGTLADSAVQPSDAASLGSITVTGLHVNSTGSVEMPTGTEAQRDGSPVAGMFRFNTDSSSFEGYDGSSWGAVGGSGGGGGAVDFTASGAITAGDPVSITGTSVEETTGSLNTTPSSTAATDHSAGATNCIVLDMKYYEAGNVMIMVYLQAASGTEVLRAVAGTISGDTVTWGTAISFSGSPTVYTGSRKGGELAIDQSSGQCFFFWVDTTDDVKCTGFEVTSGTTLSENVATSTVKSGTAFTWNVGADYDSLNDRWIYVSNNSADTFLDVSSFTLSGTTITDNGVDDTHTDADVREVSVVCTDDGRGAVIYATNASNTQILGLDLGASGPTVADSDTAFSQDCWATIIDWDPDQDVFVCGALDTSNLRMRHIAFTLDGSANITKGTAVISASGQTAATNNLNSNIQYAKGQGVFLVTTVDTGIDAAVYTVTASGTTLTIGTQHEVYADTDINGGAGGCYAPGKFMCAWGDDATSTLQVYQVDAYAITTNADSFCGFALATVADTETVSVALLGQWTADALTGQTGETQYWLNYDGTFSTSDTGYAKSHYALTPTLIRVGAQQ